MEAVQFSEPLVMICQFKLCHVLENTNLHGNEISDPVKGGEFLDQLSQY
jgi:hypothetical protein